MNKDGAAAAGNAWARVVIQLDYQVIEMILAPKPVGGARGGKLDRAVVAPVCGVLAPAIVPANGACGQVRSGTGQAVGTIPEAEEAEAAARRGTVAFALVGLDTPASERHAEDVPVQAEQAARAAAWGADYPQSCVFPR